MTSHRVGHNPLLLDGVPGLAEAPPAVWDRIRSVLRGAGRAVIRDSYPGDFARAAQTIQQPVATGRRIVVLSPAGGTGASTVASLLGAAYGSLRGDLVGVVDLNSLASGLLPWISTATTAPRQALGSLGVASPTRRDEFRHALGLGEGEIAVVRAEDYESPLDARAAETLLGEFSRQCAVTVVEAPPGADDERTLAALASAHALVVVADLTERGVREARVLAERVREIERAGGSARAGGPARRSSSPRRGGPAPVLVVGNERTAPAPRARREIRALAEQTGAQTLTLRHCRHVRRPSVQSLDGLDQGTRIEVLRIAALALTLAHGEHARAAVVEPGAAQPGAAQAEPQGGSA